MAEVDVNQVATALNLTPRRVNQLVTNDGMPQVARGVYDLGKCMHWYIRYLQTALQRRSVTDGDGVTSLTAERVRSTRESADKAALDNALRRGELVEVARVTQLINEIPLAMIQAHRTITNRCAHEFASISDANRIRERFAEEFHSVGVTLSELVERLAERSDGIAREQEAVRGGSAAHAGPVGRPEENSAEGQRGARTVSESSHAVHDADRADGDEREVSAHGGGDGGANGKDGGTA